MKIGIISDTHDQVENITKALKIFKDEGIEMLYHLGDWCSPFILHLFADMEIEVKSVFGNNDADIFKHIKYKTENVQFFDRFLEDEIDGKKIAVIHGDPQPLVDSLLSAQKYDILLRGHNHVAEIRKEGNTLMINPGNLVGPFDDMTKNWTKPSIAIYDTKSDEARLIELNQ